MKLLLWDIDGTLICSGRAGEHALIRAMKLEFGVDLTIDPRDLAGRTDTYFFGRSLKRHGLSDDLEAIHSLIDVYLTHLPEELPKRPGKTLGGILPLLEQLADREDIAQGLLTGNIEKGAQLKLQHFDFWKFFPFGAFANDSHLRNELGPHAIRRASDFHQFEFTPAHTFIIGDTPYDIECGKVIGANTIAVATGAYSIEELESHHPTAVFPDFNDPTSFLNLINN
ncbi:MAG: HAD hydrolase-like protein [Opitutaceae bacterium]|nr:HAD hydrolase-like protein [Opitutaceae bacterium]